MAGLDQRDARTWIVIELTPKGEALVQDGTLPRLLRKDLGVDEDHAVFIPAMTYVRGSRTIPVHLIEGYAFVASGLEDVAYFKLEARPYVNQVMSITGGQQGLRSLSVVPDSSVEELRTQLHGLIVQNIDVGSWVRVCEGRYHNLCGQVVGLDEEHAFIRVALRSLKFIANIPRVFLDLEDRPEDYAKQVGTSLIRVAPPTAAHFYDPVVSVLGVLSGYTQAFVSHETVLPGVLREVGISDASPPYGWKLFGRNGLYRRIGWAFRNQRSKHVQESLTIQGAKGEWGLTLKGVSRAFELNQIPSAQFFYPHILMVLGRLTNYSSRTLVPMEQVIHLVMLNSGINPDNPQRGWLRKGREGLDRRIGWACRNQREGYCRSPLTLQGDKGEWGLTQAGVIQARKLVRSGFQSTVNPEIV